ncbi:hypothetical protein [Mycolicibacillus trivialis]|uniref:hypothetical protein n=1 Tax=Mycolicibacillus trivialis TaxID=1798 RepID=UPI001F1790BE|nr:hypothetical protein [Mycolicibacillus trivialis]
MDSALLRVYGTAEVIEGPGEPYLRITPKISWSWNVNGGTGPLSMDSHAAPDRARLTRDARPMTRGR